MGKRVKGCYIAPISFLDYVPKHVDLHLCLAHLLTNDDYVNFYKDKQEQGHTIIMDNSAFEFNGSISSEQLLKLVLDSGLIPDYIVAPDYPGKPSEVTYSSMVDFIEITKDLRDKYPGKFQIMAVPQSEVGDYDGWLDCLYSMMEHKDVKMIGMSILGIPNAFKEMTGTNDISFNRIFASAFLSKDEKFLKLKEQRPDIWFHYLGASDIREFQVQSQLEIIDSFDTSSAIWHAINGIKYDNSASGLKNGKTKIPVDFHKLNTNNESIKKNIEYNIKYVEDTILNYNEEY